MAEHLAFPAILDILKSGDVSRIRASAFEILKTIAECDHGDTGQSAQARESLIRLLEFRGELPDYQEILSDLASTLGLYPYVERPEELSTGDLLAFEFNRPQALARLGEDFVFHSLQGEIYRRLISGQSIILSAPTSFGKSVILDALIASEKWRNIVVIVPTLALIDEIRRRLARFSDRYKIVTHTDQRHADRNVFVLTQERFLDIPSFPEISLFVIDEFYKLSPMLDGDDRSGLLNQAFHNLHATGAQFYLTGPNIDRLSDALPGALREKLLVTRFETVAVDIIPPPPELPDRSSEKERFLQACSELVGPTLIYSRRPSRAREMADWLLTSELATEQPSLEPLARWVEETYHPDWIVARALRHGIGIHHGATPRALGHHIVSRFNSGELRFLVCTQTLIEGVNTSAKNVVVADRRTGNIPLDFFTFANIRGRAGRMFRNFVGKVVLLEPPPAQDDLSVDIPIMSQSTSATDAMLIQVPAEHLSEDASIRVAPYLEQRVVEFDTLKANRGIDPAAQISLGREIEAGGNELHGTLHWNGYPTWEQLNSACELLLRHFPRRGRMTSAALATRILKLQQGPANIPALAAAQLPFQGNDADAAVEDVLAFQRNWAGHYLPRHLRALEAIANDVYARLRLPRVSYSHFSGEVESLFLPRHLWTLEEFGLPVQVALKLQQLGLGGETVDELLTSLRRVATHHRMPSVLSRLEREMLADTVMGLGPNSPTLPPEDTSSEAYDLEVDDDVFEAPSLADQVIRAVQSLVADLVGRRLDELPIAIALPAQISDGSIYSAEIRRQSVDSSAQDIYEDDLVLLDVSAEIQAVIDGYDTDARGDRADDEWLPLDPGIDADPLWVARTTRIKLEMVGRLDANGTLGTVELMTGTEVRYQELE